MTLTSSESLKNNTSTKKLERVPKWLPIAAFCGTTFALAIPIAMIRRQRTSALRNMLKDSSAPPPRRAGNSAPLLGKASGSPSIGQPSKNKEIQGEDSPGAGQLFSAVSNADFSSAMLAGKAFAIATCIVAFGALTTTWAVKSYLGVDNAKEFGDQMRIMLSKRWPSISARIHRQPEDTEDEYTGAGVGGDVGEEWSWERAEERLKKAYEQGGFALWAQTATREAEAERRTRSRVEHS